MSLDPKTYGQMKVLVPQNMGHITPKNEGNDGYHTLRIQVCPKKGII